jgi:hypothetical protein
MAGLAVVDTNVPELIKKLKTGEWLSPLFQRDFVWSTAAVVALVNSIIDARPVGMITLWEQEGDSALPLEPISVPDWDSTAGKTGDKYFADPNVRPGRYYAILDGRQRSTALALAFGGLRASSGVYRTAGRFFLDVKAREDSERVVFKNEKEVEKERLQILKSAVSQGLFPLEVEDPDQIFQQWMKYIQCIRDPEYYKNNNLPDEDELQRRNKVLQNAFDGIIKTKIAMYTVPSSYSLSDICDIFETLNTTGTKVSTVDLIHSNIYSDTANDPSGQILIRDEIDTIGELDGATGWASSANRPELFAQIVAASYAALDTKPRSRPIGSKKDLKVTSVKSQDLLAVPADHWRSIFSEGSSLAGFIGAFQVAVAGGHFGMVDCPYPAAATIYTALRWYRTFEPTINVEWQQEHLDNLFRAFFWRNAVSNRYDQGFLTQIGTDIREFKQFLGTTQIDEDIDHWKVRANSWLDSYLKPAEYLTEQVERIVRDGSETGALRKASLLLLISRARADVIDTNTPISFGSSDVHLHHIFPKDWCSNNKSDSLLEVLDKKLAGRDYINSPANLMPMARKSNLLWRKKSPSQAISEFDLSYDNNSDLWAAYFVSREAFQILANAIPDPKSFWEVRANSIGSEIMRRMKV